MPRMAFHIPGTPQPKGSRQALPRGGKAGSRHVVLVEAGTKNSRKTKAAWYEHVTATAKSAWASLGAKETLTGAVSVSVVFRFLIPKSRRSGSRALESGDQHVSKPDTDKLMRALGDSLVLAGVIVDDARISSWDASKVYCAPGDEGADVIITW